MNGLPAASTPGALSDAVFLLATAFDSSPVDPDGEPPEAHAALWLDRVWGEREGHACVWIGYGGHFDSRGKYTFDSHRDWFFEWPGERGPVVDLAMSDSPHADVYVAPALRATRSRKRGTALGGSVAWVDCDGQWTPERDRAVRRLAEAGTVWQVASGSGGRHVYLRLHAAEGPDGLEAVNRRLRALLDGDTKWDCTSLLRLPGTFNHKEAARGGAPTPVRWLS